MQQTNRVGALWLVSSYAVSGSGSGRAYGKDAERMFCCDRFGDLLGSQLSGLRLAKTLNLKPEIRTLNPTLNVVPFWVSYRGL